MTARPSSWSWTVATLCQITSLQNAKSTYVIWALIFLRLTQLIKFFRFNPEGWRLLCIYLLIALNIRLVYQQHVLFYQFIFLTPLAFVIFFFKVWTSFHLCIKQEKKFGVWILFKTYYLETSYNNVILSNFASDINETCFNVFTRKHDRNRCFCVNI